MHLSFSGKSNSVNTDNERARTKIRNGSAIILLLDVPAPKHGAIGTCLVYLDAIGRKKDVEITG